MRNQILMALPDDERQALAARLDPFRHHVRDTVYAQGERIESVVFPLTGVFSLVAETDDASPVEIATVGYEGLVGLPVFLQATLTGAHMAFSQVEGEALRMDAADFLDVVNGAPALRAALQRYAMALMTQVARGAACNRVHPPEQRAARWLLQTHDRVDGDGFLLRAEFLAQMLGEPPAAVRAVVDALDGAVAYDEERMTVRDRAALERASCDCYGIVREEYDRLLEPAGVSTATEID
ncbi:MAG TPA: Crp/Fnr family transcriptional regulator [Solirubrobacter sp.]|nr:Crp/Fnr family transcriptional regulator [Solirubrobacter sp.]